MLIGKPDNNVKIAILTKSIGKVIRLDLQKHPHDRFLLIDEKIYHLSASLKDLGKKWFAFSLIGGRMLLS